MTREEFTAFYPQFASFSPSAVLSSYLEQANARFSSFGSDAEEARRLFLAHKLTLYAFSAPPEGAQPSLSVLASAGQARQKIASKKVGEAAVAYASAASSASSSLSDLPETAFGLQLLSLLRLYGRSIYIP